MKKTGGNGGVGWRRREGMGGEVKETGGKGG